MPFAGFPRSVMRCSSMTRIHLPPHDLGVLQTAFRTASDRRLRDRAQIILMAHRGRPHQVIAEDLGINRRGVSRWLNAYREHGLDGLRPRYAKGSPRIEDRYPGITDALEALLSDELALAGSPEGEQKWVRSSAKNLSQRLRELGFDVGRDAVLALLKRMGFSMRMNVRKRKGLCGDPAVREEQFCDPFRLTVTVCHYPPGCSKWNPVEYRLFSQIRKN